MRASAFKVTGGPEVLRLVDLPDPEPGPGEILIRVAYAGVNYGEIQHRLGDFGEPDGETVTGLEASGRVAALGEGVTGFSVGDPVTAYLPDGGGYAEYAVAPATFTFPLLVGLDLRTAGGAALVLTTAYGVLVGAARIAPGDTVLVHAAAGGVGGVAAQLARALGASEVYGTVSTPEKAEYARRSFGYDEVFVREGFPEAVLAATSGRGVDIVLDPVGGPTRLASFEVLAPFGRVAVYGEAARHPDLQLPVLPIWKNNRTLTGYNIGDLARRAPDTVRTHALAALALAASGAVRIDVTEEYALADTAEAHRLLGEGRNRGKVVLAVGDPA
ncbi:quinone oxidoreductase family protein [Streptomyces hokutonensis]|uniref:quinone oxidoreductase family protein n=1 Tax=Streptomyces hokutonensis TaxID=1306990 RepID=UPI00036E823D|nr:zinc-binding dehydrogenase [Streptomyces hokutonensis]